MLEHGGTYWFMGEALLKIACITLNCSAFRFIPPPIPTTVAVSPGRYYAGTNSKMWWSVTSRLKLSALFNSGVWGISVPSRAMYYPRHWEQILMPSMMRSTNSHHNGVYQSGNCHHAGKPYEEGVFPLFKAWDKLRTPQQKSLFRGQWEIRSRTWRLFYHLWFALDIRMYHGHFKCNLQRIETIRNLSNNVRGVINSMAGVCWQQSILQLYSKLHYYTRHLKTHLIPLASFSGGAYFLWFDRPHKRVNQYIVASGKKHHASMIKQKQFNCQATR